MLPAASHLRLHHTTRARVPRLLITLPRLRQPGAATAVYAWLLFRASFAVAVYINALGGGQVAVLRLALFCLWAACGVVFTGVPGRQALKLDVSPTAWRPTQRRRFRHMLPGCAIVSAGHTADIATVEVRA